MSGEQAARTALWWHASGETAVCELCPHHCRIVNGSAGRCRYRRNVDGNLVAANYGRISSYGYDPIEKKPLYHFAPGSSIFSVGTVGCNFGCAYCQNWQISQMDAPTTFVSPAAAARMAGERDRAGRRSIGIAFTYSEPVVWWEYVYDTANAVKAAGLATVLVTNGYIEREPLAKLLPLVDAMNVDIKSFRDDFYREICGGRLAPVLRTVELAHAAGVHIEVTTLVVPQRNDNPAEIGELAAWLASLSREIPLHLSRYFPNYKMASPPPTPVDTLLAAYEAARRHLDYVYLGNVLADTGADTICPQCGALVIGRDGYRVSREGLVGNVCASCGHRVVAGPAGGDVVN